MSTTISRYQAFVSFFRDCIVYTILGCTLLVHPSIAQTIPESAHDASHEWSRLGDVGPGIHYGDDFLFAVVELPWRGNVRRLEAVANLELNALIGNALLLEHLSDGHRKAISGHLIDKTDASIAAPQELRVSIQVIQSGPKVSNADIYRRVIAIPMDAVEEFGFGPTEAEEIYQGLIGDFIQDWLRHPEALEQLGFGLLGLIAERHVLGQQIHMVNVLAPDVTPLQTRARYAEYVVSGDFQPASLVEWPGEYEVVAIQMSRYGDRSRRGLAWASIACLDPRSKFSEQLQAVIGSPVRQQAAVSEQSGAVFKAAVRCGGFVSFDSQFSAEEPAFFPELRRLFAAGKDLPAALSLALKSVEVSPAFADGWGYLSAAFKADGNVAAAQIASLVRLSLEPSSSAAIKQYLLLTESYVDDQARQFIRDATALLDKN